MTWRYIPRKRRAHQAPKGRHPPPHPPHQPRRAPSCPFPPPKPKCGGRPPPLITTHVATRVPPSSLPPGLPRLHAAPLRAPAPPRLVRVPCLSSPPVSPRRVSPEPTQAPLLAHSAFLFSHAVRAIRFLRGMGQLGGSLAGCYLQVESINRLQKWGIS